MIQDKNIINNYYKQLLNIQIQLKFLESKIKQNIKKCNTLTLSIDKKISYRESRDKVLQKSINSTYSIHSLI